jgi:hypothetical protein
MEGTGIKKMGTHFVRLIDPVFVVLYDRESLGHYTHFGMMKRQERRIEYEKGVRSLNLEGHASHLGGAFLMATFCEEI